jgi:hypothetical protein
VERGTVQRSGLRLARINLPRLRNEARSDSSKSGWSSEGMGGSSPASTGGRTTSRGGVSRSGFIGPGGRSLTSFTFLKMQSTGVFVKPYRHLGGEFHALIPVTRWIPD